MACPITLLPLLVSLFYFHSQCIIFKPCPFLNNQNNNQYHSLQPISDLKCAVSLHCFKKVLPNKTTVKQVAFIRICIELMTTETLLIFVIMNGKEPRQQALLATTFKHHITYLTCTITYFFIFLMTICWLLWSHFVCTAGNLQTLIYTSANLQLVCCAGKMVYPRCVYIFLPWIISA